jgi:hypothetical protein
VCVRPASAAGLESQPYPRAGHPAGLAFPSRPCRSDLQHPADGERLKYHFPIRPGFEQSSECHGRVKGAWWPPRSSKPLLRTCSGGSVRFPPSPPFFKPALPRRAAASGGPVSPRRPPRVRQRSPSANSCERKQCLVGRYGLDVPRPRSRPRSRKHRGIRERGGGRLCASVRHQRPAWKASPTHARCPLGRSARYRYGTTAKRRFTLKAEIGSREGRQGRNVGESFCPSTPSFHVPWQVKAAIHGTPFPLRTWRPLREVQLGA